MDFKVFYLIRFVLFRQKLCNDEDENQNTRKDGQSSFNFQNSTSATSSWSSQQSSKQQHPTKTTFNYQQNNQSYQNTVQKQNKTSFTNFYPQNQNQKQLPPIREENESYFTKK